MLLYEIEINSTFEYVDMAVSFAAERISAVKILSEYPFLFICISALRELLSNAIEHGNKLVVEKKVLCKITYSSSQIRIDVRDEGKGFSLKKAFYGTPQEDILSERGRGLSIISKLGFKLQVKGNLVTARLNIEDFKM